MVSSRRLLLGLAMAACSVAPLLLAAPPASAAFAVTGTGTVACTGVTGTVKFGPSVTLVGGQVSATVKVVFHGCDAGAGTNVSTTGFIGKGRGTLSVVGGTDCASLVGASPAFQLVGSIEVRWTAKVDRAPGKAPYQIDPTTVTVGQMRSVGSGGNGNIGLTFGRQAVSGSFASSASSFSGELDSTRAASKVVCGGNRVVKKLSIESGKLAQP
jgi:hypothetical protein